MTPRKPDRFERMADGLRQDSIASPWATQIPLDAWPDLEHRVRHLLRNEHAWMRRMVKKIDAWACQELADNEDVIAEILSQLAQRRK